MVVDAGGSVLHLVHGPPAVDRDGGLWPSGGGAGAVGRGL